MDILWLGFHASTNNMQPNTINIGINSEYVSRVSSSFTLLAQKSASVPVSIMFSLGTPTESVS